jgi:hypothetical protein
VKATAFVKSGGTSVPVSRSQAELEKILRRYGATGFGVTHDYQAMKASVHFRVPDSLAKDAPQVPVRLDVDVRNVYDALYGRPMKTRWVEERRVTEWNPAGYEAKPLAQAERVAWRQLILWVDAACSASAAGLQRISEAFFAHTLIRNEAGETHRLVDHLDQVSGGNWRALLGPGT